MFNSDFGIQHYTVVVKWDNNSIFRVYTLCLYKSYNEYTCGI